MIDVMYIAIYTETNEMGGARSAYVKEERRILGFGGKT
jgi:hypothetical protein